MPLECHHHHERETLHGLVPPDCMLIRPCRPGEAMALLALFQSPVHGLAARDYTPQQIEAWSPSQPDAAFCQAWVRRIEANRPWVVETGGALAAYADLQASGLIDQFFVAAEWGGHGVGAALMRHLLAQARARGMARLWAHVSLTAQPFFRRFGFVIEQEQLPVVRGVALRNAVMGRLLADADADAAA